MKKLNALSMVAAILTLSLAGSASAAVRPLTPAQQNAFWLDVRDLIVKCAVAPVAMGPNGRKVHGKLQSVCSELQVRNDQARFFLQGRGFQALIQESPLSDGGDLYDLYVRTADGSPFIRVQAVAAFGDPLLALIGGNHSAGMVREVPAPPRSFQRQARGRR